MTDTSKAAVEMMALQIGDVRTNEWTRNAMTPLFWDSVAATLRSLVAERDEAGTALEAGRAGMERLTALLNTVAAESVQRWERAMAAEAERDRLREAIRTYVETEGHRTFDGPGKIAKCSHGQYTWEECGQCNAEWFIAALSNG